MNEKGYTLILESERKRVRNKARRERKKRQKLLKGEFKKERKEKKN